jgi:hypothetical protein
MRTDALSTQRKLECQSMKVGNVPFLAYYPLVGNDRC